MDEKCLNCDNLIKGKTNEEIEDLIFKFIILQNKIIGRKRDWTRRSHKLHESHKTIFQNEPHSHLKGYGQDNYNKRGGSLRLMYILSLYTFHLFWFFSQRNSRQKPLLYS